MKGKIPPIPRFKTRFIRGGMDTRFITRNWAALNKHPIAKSAALIRTIMRGSIRRATISKRTGKVSEKPSPPGKPPRSRYQGHPFKLILYQVFPSGDKAVIGHPRLPYKQQDPRVTPMEAHEFGRRVRIQVKQPQPARRRAVSERQRRAARRLYLQGRIQSRPQAPPLIVHRYVQMPKRRFALPALLKASTRIGQFWSGFIKKATVKSRF